MWLQALPYKGVLDSYIPGLIARFLRVSIDGKTFIAPPSDRHVIKNHIRAVSDTGGIFTVFPVHSHPYAQIAANEIVGPGKRNMISINDNSVTGSRLCSNSQILGKSKRGLQANDSRNIKNNDSSGFTHRITQRAFSRVGKRSDVIDLAMSSAYRIAPVPFCSRKSKYFSVIRERNRRTGNLLFFITGQQDPCQKKYSNCSISHYSNLLFLIFLFFINKLVFGNRYPARITIFLGINRRPGIDNRKVTILSIPEK